MFSIRPSTIVSLFATAATWLVAANASADFCAGKSNGYWCDANTLRLCSGGVITGSQACSCGCQAMPPGVDDACAPCAGFCAGQSNGLYCNGGVLTNCQGGAVASTQNCQCGCTTNPPGTPDACTTCGGSDFCSGKSNGAFCNGSILTNCAGGVTSSAQPCTCGCTENPPGTPDACTSCGGGSSDFCNGKQDGDWCNNGGLTTCSAGKTASSTPCPNGCQSMPAGTPDQCAAGAPGFCTGKNDGSHCNDSTLVECGGGKQLSVKSCPSGCLVMEGDLPDVCILSGGDFCSDKTDGYWCNGELLVRCTGHSQQTSLPCSQGCVQMPPGQDDYCNFSSGNVPPGQSITVTGGPNECSTVTGNLNLYAGKGLPVFDQTQYPQQLGTCSGKTIKNWGCLITSLSMLYAYYGTGRPVDGTLMADPVVENNWRTQNGGYFEGCWADVLGHNPPGVAPQWHTEWTQCATGATAKVIADSLMMGNPVVAGVRYTPCPASGDCYSDHWVLIVGADEKGFIFNDPIKGKANLHFNEGWKSYTLYEFVTYNVGGGGGALDGQGRPSSGSDWHPGPVTPYGATANPEASSGCSFGTTGAAASGASLVSALMLLASRRNQRRRRSA